jgi:short-subunit dehydrogenase
VHLAKRLVQPMVERGEGRLLFTASVAATMPGPFYATYAASKSFVHSFAEAIRYELHDTGVTVTSLMPGPTDTEFFARAGMEDTKVGQSCSKDDPADVARQGFEALMAGKDHVVAGSAMNKAQTAAGKLLGDPMKARIHASMTEPGADDS